MSEPKTIILEKDGELARVDAGAEGDIAALAKAGWKESKKTVADFAAQSAKRRAEAKPK